MVIGRNDLQPGASDYHRMPQDTIGHPRTPQDSTRHPRTVPVYLKLLTFIIFSMLKSFFFYDEMLHLVIRKK